MRFRFLLVIGFEFLHEVWTSFIFYTGFQRMFKFICTDLSSHCESDYKAKLLSIANANVQAYTAAHTTPVAIAHPLSNSHSHSSPNDVAEWSANSGAIHSAVIPPNTAAYPETDPSAFTAAVAASFITTKPYSDATTELCPYTYSNSFAYIPSNNVAIRKTVDIPHAFSEQKTD